MRTGSRCAVCGVHTHGTGSCPFISRRSSVFGSGPRISMDAMPTKQSDYHHEIAFERQVCTKDRDAFKTLMDGGIEPSALKGSERLLRHLGG